MHRTWKLRYFLIHHPLGACYLVKHKQEGTEYIAKKILLGALQQ